MGWCVSVLRRETWCAAGFKYWYISWSSTFKIYFSFKVITSNKLREAFLGTFFSMRSFTANILSLNDRGTLGVGPVFSPGLWILRTQLSLRRILVPYDRQVAKLDSNQHSVPSLLFRCARLSSNPFSESIKSGRARWVPYFFLSKNPLSPPPPVHHASCTLTSVHLFLFSTSCNEHNSSSWYDFRTEFPMSSSKDNGKGSEFLYSL